MAWKTQQQLDCCSTAAASLGNSGPIECEVADEHSELMRQIVRSRFRLVWRAREEGRSGGEKWRLQTVAKTLQV